MSEREGDRVRIEFSDKRERKRGRFEALRGNKEIKRFKIWGFEDWVQEGGFQK